MSYKKIKIAIDGYSSCGKSTLAKDLAKHLNYLFVDSGSMYRAISLFTLNRNLIKNNKINKESLLKSLHNINISFKIDTKTKSPQIILNGKNVNDEIRTPKVADIVSKVAEIPEVRKKLVKEQRKIGKNGGIVMDGRDIGSIVFPDSELKLFVTADIDVRVNRRFKDLKSKNIEISKKEVKMNLVERDLRDSNRKTSPLKQTKDAILIDNTLLSRKEQLDVVLNLIKSKKLI
ncbi:MAG: cytidylate kinase [Crocinitomicaceae bacterium]|nr:cytidylate kinase [Crocinitomicaceae bacterium]